MRSSAVWGHTRSPTCPPFVGWTAFQTGSCTAITSGTQQRSEGNGCWWWAPPSQVDSQSESRGMRSGPRRQKRGGGAHRRWRAGDEIARLVAREAVAVHHTARAWVSEQYNQPRDNLERMAWLAELTDGGEAVFEDGARRRVDSVIYCTGYRYCFPFLEGTGLVSTGKAPPRCLERGGP